MPRPFSNFLAVETQSIRERMPGRAERALPRCRSWHRRGFLRSVPVTADALGAGEGALPLLLSAAFFPNEGAIKMKGMLQP